MRICVGADAPVTLARAAPARSASSAATAVVVCVWVMALSCRTLFAFDVPLLMARAVLASGARARAGDCEEIPVWRDGHRAGTVCRADAAARGLTILDLGDDWV